MNKKLTIKLSLLALAMVTVFTSCATDNDENMESYLPTALVTVKPVNNERFFLQLDDSTRLEPSNLTKSPFGDKTVRALVNYKIEEKKSGMQRVHINWMDSIRTKPTVLSLGDKNNTTYGYDPVEIVKDWVTVAEDGFLTLRVRTRWGYNTTHYLNLLRGVNPQNPYELELRHDARGDLYGNMGDAFIAFNLRDVLANAETEKVKFTLRWRSFSGEKKVDFELKSKPMDDLGNTTRSIVLSKNIE